MKVVIILSFFLFFIYGCKKDNIDTSSPAEVSNVNLICGDSTITLVWTDPIDDDLSKIEISYENDTIYVQKGIESLEIINVEAGIYYTFTIKTIDKKGNKSTGFQIQGKIDYRLRYTGDFEFFSYNLDFSYPIEIDNDTMNFLGNITIIEDSDSLIQINYRSENKFAYCADGISIQPKINSKGLLSNSSLFDCDYSKISGKFYGYDSLNISIGIYMSEGLGSWGQNISGKRFK